VPLLPASLPARPLAARTTRSRRRILRRRKRRVPRTLIQTTLQLGNPSLEPFIRRDQTLVRIHQLVEPQQQPNSRLTIAIEDRLRLGPLHTKPFAARTRVPAPPERLHFKFFEQDTFTGTTGTLTGDKYSLEFKWTYDGSGNVTHIYSDGVQEKVTLPNGHAVLISVGRVDYLSGNPLEPVFGHTSGFATLCAAIGA
jgi:hypothetical protein